MIIVAQTLVVEEPALTLRKLKRNTFLKPVKLIPALVRYSQIRQSQVTARDNADGAEAPLHPVAAGKDLAVSYLRRLIDRGCKDEAIHNFYLSLLAIKDGDNALMNYLENQIYEAEEKIIDLKYALRVCTRNHKQRACVLIYCGMELWHEAVVAALDVDLELAKRTASTPQSDPDLKRALWMLIAEHLVDKNQIDEYVPHANTHRDTTGTCAESSRTIIAAFQC